MTKLKLSKLIPILAFLFFGALQACSSSGDSTATATADKGQKFLKIFYVDSNIDEGYKMLHSEAKAQYKVDDFKQVLVSSQEKFGKATTI